MTSGPAALAWSRQLSAQTDRPVRLILPVQAGSGVDATARVMVEALSRALEQTVVIDNQPGAGGTMGTAQIARAAPDGRTIGMISTNHAVNPSIYARLPYDSLTDITAIVLVVRTPLVILAHPSLGLRNIADLVAIARSRPGKLNYGSSGNGTILHIAMAWVAVETGIDILHVPYRGAGQLLQDLLAGQIQLGAFAVSVASPHVRSDRLTALGITTKTRAPILPDVPTVAEQGIPDYEIDGWSAAIGPKNLPATIVRRTNAAFHEAIAVPSVHEALLKQGNIPAPGTPQRLSEFLQAEVAKYADVARRTGIRLD